MQWSMKSAALLATLLWFLTLLYISSHLFGIQTKSSNDEESWREAAETMRMLKRQNEELKNLIEAERRERAERDKEDKESRQSLMRQLETYMSQHSEHHQVPAPRDPQGKEAGKAKAENEKSSSRTKADAHDSNTQLFSKEYEIARRKLHSNIWEIFYYMKQQYKTLLETHGQTYNHTQLQLYSLLADSERLGEVDGAVEWRRKELQKLTDVIQKKIFETQNPTDCKASKVLTCNLDKECGFGCQMHHVAYCFVTAFGTGRMLVLNYDGRRWRYSARGWEGAFLPLTNCSYSDAVGDEKSHPFSVDSKERVVALPIIDGLYRKPEFLPLSFPTELSERMLTLHSNPPLFFISQFLFHMMRSNKEMGEIVDRASRNISFDEGPIVGLQVRRTDKVGTEAAFHSVSEYMEWAEIWFQIQERKSGKPIKRRVYIASDDPSVVPEARKLYPRYTVYGDTSIADTAQVGKRYTDASLHGVVTDIRLLSQCDYLVCTFSSQVCRMGFEVMQVLRGDAGELFHSLDDLYYYGGQHAHEQVAVEAHQPETSKEIELQVGDVVGVAGNHWDGWSKGTNRRTGQSGLYPSYKVIEKWRIIDLPQGKFF